MKPNLAWHNRNDSSLACVEVLDDSLFNYGLRPGVVVSVRKEASAHGGIPVWELDGALHGRFLEHHSLGWAQLWTNFLSSGRICYSLNPTTIVRLKEVGWITSIAITED